MMCLLYVRYDVLFHYQLYSQISCWLMVFCLMILVSLLDSDAIEKIEN